MRALLAAGIAGSLIVSSSVMAAVASPGAVPTGANVTFAASLTVGLRSTAASVSIVADDDASAIDIEVYGLDGMQAGNDNHVRIHQDRLAKGAEFAFDVPIRPGPGRSFLVVAAKARFVHAGNGQTLRTFPFGAENDEQQREHSRCVRQDPDGVWIRLPDCDEAAPQQKGGALPPSIRLAAASGSGPLPALTLAQLKASPPVGQTAQIAGYVVDTYFCPPCPRGAQCKPCASLSAVFVADTQRHVPFALDAPPADVIAIGTADAAQFERGGYYRFEIEVTDRKQAGLDGRMLRSQRSDP